MSTGSEDNKPHPAYGYYRVGKTDLVGMFNVAHTQGRLSFSQSPHMAKFEKQKSKYLVKMSQTGKSIYYSLSDHDDLLVSTLLPIYWSEKVDLPQQASKRPPQKLDLRSLMAR